MKKAAHIFKIGLTVFLFGALPLVVFTLITSKTGVIGDIRSFTVLSGSMEPTLPVGSIIYTKAQHGYSVGDVVSVKTDKGTVTHRIKNEVKNGKTISYQLKGDANKNVDGKLVSKSDVIGKQFYMVPQVGKISAFVRTPQGFISLVVLPAVIVIAFELWAIKKEIEIQTERRIRNELGATT